MKKFFYSFIALLLVIGTTIAVSYAWFMNREFEEPKISGYSTAAYFASGDGSEERPYIITNRRHLYNLAWLQYLGNFNGTEVVDGKTNLKQQFHFKVTATNGEIDMDGYSLPPIGTEQYPFVGTFDGGGCVIKNLTTSNNIAEVQNHPQTVNEIQNASIIGMFGVVGNYNEMYANIETTTSTDAPSTNSIVPDISNFYLDNIMISTNTETSLVGLLAGYVSKSGKVSNVGIHYSMFKLSTGVKMIESFKAISNYTLIGDYDAESIEWGDKPSGGGPGQDLAYGGNFDVNLMLQRLNLIKENNGASPFLPGIDSGTNEYPVPASGNKLPLTVVPTTITTENYTGNTAKETVSSQNIGYYIGNQNKISKSNINFCDPMIEPSDMNAAYADASGKTPTDLKKTPRQFFVVKGGNGNYAKTNIEAMDSETFESLPQNIKDIIPSENETKTEYTIRLSQRYSGSINVTNNNQNDAWSYQGQINYFGETYGEDVANYNTSGVCLPNNAIWFRSQKAGKLRFIMYSGSNGKSFKLIKITRNSATPENPFAGQDVTGSEVTYITDTAKNIPLYLLVYYEYEVTQEEIDAGNVEFMLTRGDENGAYFLYMDIGINGNGENPEPEYTGSISGVDFVYSTGSGYSDLTEKSNVLFGVNGETTSQVILYFKRKETLGVLYFVSGSGVTITEIGTGTKSPASDENCDEKAS